MRRLRPLSPLLLCAGCNVLYPSERDPPLPFYYPDAYSYFDRPRDALRPDAAPRDASVATAVGLACEDAACPNPLVCVARSCGPERSCAVPVTLCPQEFAPVCDCTGSTALNECAARASGAGVAYAGACDGRTTEDGGLDAGADADPDAGPNRCARAVCDDGYVCCAEPDSPAYGRCQPLACATCCRRAG
jgi:hypothetical protein